MTVFRKAFALIDPVERAKVVSLLFMMLIGVFLETLSIGLAVPALALMLQGDLAARYPTLQPILQSLGNPSQARLLLGAMICLVVTYAIKNAYILLLTWRQARFATDMQADLSARLFSLYLHQPYTFHLARNSAQLITNITSEVGVCTLVITNTMNITTEMLVLAGLGALLLTVEPIGTIIVVGVLGTAAWGFYRATRGRVGKWGDARQYHGVMSVQHLQQGLGGAKDVKLMGREDQFVAQYARHVKAMTRIIGHQSIMQQIPRLWLELLAVTGMALLVASMLLRGHDLAGIVTTVGLFAAAAFRLMPSVNRLLGSAQALRFSLPAIDTVYNELQLDKPSLNSTESMKSNRIRFEREIEIRHLTFAYPDADRIAVSDVSMSIRKGESVGLIGTSGSGKSTTIDLILGLLTATSGLITVDGQDIRADLRGWQNQIGYVPQSIYLTDDTLRRNVAFGVPDDQIDDEAVKRAIEAAQLTDFVETLTQQLETVVGERGVRLSGGQRQRIGIARALYHDPSVLVLDEATSALDTVTESGVMEAVNALRGSKTILIVAHRLSTIEHCDKLYRLEDGKISAHGTPAELGIREFGK